MARTGTPWPVVVTVLLCALVAAGALAVAAAQRGSEDSSADDSQKTSTSRQDDDGSGCRIKPCTVLQTVPIGDTNIDLLADAGATSGRVRIGGPGASQVIEVAITGVTLTGDSLQCSVSSLSGCMIRGASSAGTVGQVVVGRSGKWSSIEQQFVSDAGYLALAEVDGQVGPEIVAVQYDCDRATTPDCTGRPVFAQVFMLSGAEVGCTRTVTRIESLPGFPVVDPDRGQLRPCG